MKSSFLRPAMALALALGLSACGGSATYTVGGPIDGLVYPGLVLANGGAELAVAAGSTSYAFPGTIEYGKTYAVTVKTNPAHQSCVAIERYATGTAGQTAGINAAVGCVINTFTVGGKVSGLTTEGLVLTNGTEGGTATILKDATAFTFATPVKYGETYGVTILKQPAGQTCTLSNGVGLMGDAKVENIQVTCNTSIGS
ncbi:MAG: hypothetical protein ACXW2U_04490 [Telluria sp.]